MSRPRGYCQRDDDPSSILEFTRNEVDEGRTYLYPEALPSLMTTDAFPKTNFWVKVLGSEVFLE